MHKTMVNRKTYLTRRIESFLMFTRLRNVLVGSCACGGGYGNYNTSNTTLHSACTLVTHKHIAMSQEKCLCAHIICYRECIEKMKTRSTLLYHDNHSTSTSVQIYRYRLLLELSGIDCWSDVPVPIALVGLTGINFYST